MSAAQELGTWFFNHFDHLPFSLIFEEDESSIGPVRRLQDGHRARNDAPCDSSVSLFKTFGEAATSFYGHQKSAGNYIAVSMGL